MLEAGSVRTTAYSNIIFKNFIDAAIAGICFWAFGYAIAYGNGNDNGSAEAFWGSGDYFLSDLGKDRTFASYESWFFQYTFAATAATIVSGCIAERAKLMGYVAISIILTTFTYPVVVHWVWDSHGWLSAFNADARKALGTDDKGSYGVIDFAGSGVVHMVGGLAGLVGAAIIGGRVIFREDGTYYNPMFETKDGKKHPMFGIKARLLSAYLPLEEQVEKIAPSSRLYAALGTGILWFGWYGFNCGSALGVSEVSARVAVTTTLGASGGIVTGFVFGFFKDLTFDPVNGLNGALAGLVAITAGCSVVEPGSALAIGAIGGIVWVVSSHLIYVCGIDDPLTGSAVHGITGIWGLISVAIFAEDETIMAAGYSLPNDYTGTDKTAEHFGIRLGVQLLAAVVIGAWTIANALVMFAPLRLLDVLVLKWVQIDGTSTCGPEWAKAIAFAVGLRIHPKTDQIGIDVMEHGANPKEVASLIERSPPLKPSSSAKAPPVPELDLESGASAPKGEVEMSAVTTDA
jgi:Amt family ammonium transporter